MNSAEIVSGCDRCVKLHTTHYIVVQLENTVTTENVNSVRIACNTIEGELVGQTTTSFYTKLRLNQCHT